MRIAFAGTPEFAARALDALVQSSHPVLGVLTQPDRPAGRGRKLTPSPVKQRALAAGLEIRQPDTLRDPAQADWLRALRLDVLVVAAYGLILPQSILDIPRLGCLNIHASLLPRWRGAAPIQRAIEAGDRCTGISIMQMEAGLDTGPVLLSESLAIDDNDTGASLHDQLATLGARLIVKALDGLQRGQLQARPQDESRATYAHKLSKDEARMDWSQDAALLARRIRAFNPWPMAFTLLDTGSEAPLRLRLLAAHALPEPGAMDTTYTLQAGTVTEVDAQGIVIACGRGHLRLIEVQPPGRKAMPAAQLARNLQLARGARFS
ncbi:MAG: methionyl-tRNA formyltransferase [Gammaproteobacteria bacterium]|nr:methionyl-tRNA formyltransferase [Gammaproteobacteria bacterium]